MDALKSPAEARWEGDCPVFLSIMTPLKHQLIDLDERGWSKKYKNLMRKKAYWFLRAKAGDGRAILQMAVNPGDQPYYTRRTVGVAGSGGSNAVAFHGIGKKRPDGHVDRLWLAPDGAVCGGDDVDQIGVEYVKRLGPRPVPEEAPHESAVPALGSHE